MPGKHARPSKLGGIEILYVEIMPYFTVGLLLFLEILGMCRYFYWAADHWKYSFECVFWTLFFVVGDYAVIGSLWRVKNEDPGYVITYE